MGHPRTYGATRHKSPGENLLKGSSPHLRGNHHHHRLRHARNRVIPAPTGQPRARCRCCGAPRGHPRTYGATIGGGVSHLTISGSSPHLRGNPYFEAVGDRSEGVIPAPTGQPVTATDPEGLDRGHPRTYGATSTSSPVMPRATGSSPHLRGNRETLAGVLRALRVIPAPTGQPRPGCPTAPGRAGHPRTYGATRVGQPGPLSDRGSSPHLRGNR